MAKKLRNHALKVQPCLCLLLIIISLFAKQAMTAQTFVFDNLNYEVINHSEKKVKVARNANASGSIVIPSTVTYNDQVYTVTEIGKEAFYNTTIEDVEMPNTLTKISPFAFGSCYGITSLVVPENVDTIGENAFMWCWSMEHIELGRSVKYIGTRAFRVCTSLKEITIPASVNYVGSAFESCYDLKSVTIEDSPNELLLSEYYLQSISPFANSSLEYLYVGRNLDDTSNGLKIGADSVVIGEMVTRIGYRMLRPRQEHLVIPESVTEIAQEGLANSSFKSVKLPENLKIIGASAFQNCSNLESITIPASVESIQAAFLLCNNLKDITICSGNNELKISGLPFTKNAVENVKIFRPLTLLSDNYAPFKNSTSLKNIWIDDHMTSTLKEMFSGCSNLENVYIGEGVESIESQIFSGCSSMKMVHLGSNVAKIKNEAFDYCTNIDDFYILAETSPTLYPFCLDEIDKSKCHLHCPVIQSYASADQWCEFKNIDSSFPISFDQKFVKAKVGTTFKLNPNVNISSKNVGNQEQSLSWYSTNPWIATVDADGNVTILKEQFVTIGAFLSSGEMASYSINGEKGEWIDASVGLYVIDSDDNEIVSVYNLQGMFVKQTYRTEATSNLPSGIYIIGGKKVLVR